MDCNYIFNQWGTKNESKTPNIQCDIIKKRRDREEAMSIHLGEDLNPRIQEHERIKD